MGLEGGAETWEVVAAAEGSVPALAGHAAVALDASVFLFGGFDRAGRPNTRTFHLRFY